MKLGRFIPSNSKGQGSFGFSATAANFATITVAVGVLALIVSFSILNGFKNHIKKVIYEINGHFEISYISDTYGINSHPIRLDSSIYSSGKELYEEINEVSAAAYKGFLLQHDNQVEGLVIKGYDSVGCALVSQNIIAGKPLEIDSPRNVLVSEIIAQRLGLTVGDKIVGNFFSKQLKHRKLKVVGVYKTNLSEFDKTYVLSTLELIQGLNKWKSNEAGVIELTLNEGTDELEMFNRLRKELYYDVDVLPTQDKYEHIFQWLSILDQNVMVLIVILFVLVLFSITSTMYILIYERNQMVGVLKSLGASNRQILNIFLKRGLKIGVVGLLIGNVVGISLMYLQKTFRVIKLDPEHYYMDYVPVNVDFVNILSVNFICILIVFLLLQLPYFVLISMKPVDNLKFS